MSNYVQLQATLKEVFEIDKADLDFGIYRIMNQKREQVMDFIDNRLPKEIKEILASTQSKDGVALHAELDKMGRALDEAGVLRESSPKYIALQQQIANSIDTNALEQEVFSHLAGFFKRYYKEGDFISMRRYKKDVYAIPYEGEEVKLHWANHDQYYIKTSEYLKNYSFKLKDGKIVHFQLKEATTEQNNNKTQGDTERRFAIYTELPLEVENDELYINFSYEPHKKTVKQSDLAAEAVQTVQQNLPGEFAAIFDKAPTEANKTRTVLDKHLNDFISRNSFDYFIHKDLGGFLRRELDFYIKNEVLFIDDINTENPAFFTAQLSKIKALKTVACKVIDFVAQVEDFQKKLWLKKKFVTSTNYCITLDRIPEKYYEEIATNSAQVTEWENLFALDATKTGLKEQLFLVLDTKFYSEEFKDRLLAEYDELDEESDGLLLNSENFQALHLLQEKYKQQVKHCYIDPPFNLGENADYLYKVDYKDATWFTLLSDRLLLGKSLLTNEGSQTVRCNHDGNMLVRMLLDSMFEKNNYRNEIIVRRAEESKGDLNKQFGSIKSITVNYDNLYWYSKNQHTRYSEFKKKTNEKQSKAHWHSFWKAEDRPNMRYNILGLDLNNHYGQWMWSRERAYRAVENYNEYKELHKLENIGLEEYWYANAEKYFISKGVKMEFVDRFGDGWSSIKYWIPPRAEVMADNNWLDIKGYANVWKFKTENSEGLLKRIIETLTKENEVVLDYFDGSGTTTATAHKLRRKWIGIEMGDYFETITKRRMVMVLGGENSGISKEIDYKPSGMFKYQTLESYEDVLNNLVLEGKSAADLFTGAAKEQYQLKYMLDLESREHLFDIDIFRNPFSYTLNITQNNEQVPTVVDLVETFNYLIGLYVQRQQRVKDDKRDIKLVEGKTREGKKTLVIWRNLELTTNEETQKVFRQIYDGIRSAEFDQIFINGDHHFENMRIGEDSFKIKLIEEVFFKKMFNN